MRQALAKTAEKAVENPKTKSHGERMQAKSRCGIGSCQPIKNTEAAMRKVPTQIIPRKMGWDIRTIFLFRRTNVNRPKQKANNIAMPPKDHPKHLTARGINC